MSFQEPTVVINDVELTSGEAMAVRVALEAFSTSLMEDGLGDDDHGKAMVKGYMKNIESIRKSMYKE